MERISRKAAKAAGLKYYFTGEPCKRGHVDVRFVCSFCCKTCERDKTRALYQQLDASARAAYYASRKAYLLQWRATHPELARELNARSNAAAKQRNPDYFKQNYAKNREHKKKASNKWYHANPERAKATQQQYAKNNRDKIRVLGRKSANTRRARTKQVFVEAVDPRVVFERDRGVCGICGLTVDPVTPWEVDHVMPISKGGLHCYANVQLAHRTCNRSKAAKCA